MIIQKRAFSLILNPSYSYVSSKVLSEIKNQNINPIKKVIEIATYICKTGYYDAKEDIKFFRE